MKNNIPIVESVRERDVDLLILEEFYSETGFERLFLNKINKENLKFLCAYRSVTTSGLGETDLQIEFLDEDNKTFYLLIENKIDAPFQEAQYERYLKRATALSEDNSKVILVAPEGYIKNKNEFEYHISYEELSRFFENKKGSRNEYKMEILRLAIEQERRGYQIIKDEQVTAFWKEYYIYVKINIPELEMPDPKSKPSSSSFVYFKSSWVPKNMKLIHKMEKGNLDLELSGQADKYEEIIEKYKENIIEDIEIVVTGKSLVFRTNVPDLNLKNIFEEERDKMEEFISKYNLLKNWFLSTI
ncbi:hypothetical protein SDC9_21681 [bioreactor metagenome]|uniref:PD-(D/E)XK nuclease superfamily protein n=1 Tax=bioreactor metagenome TaxID=1076179 RepID=A0A644UA54_9ZZZZ|nr:PD-(D/E)XK nuclease family protein [Candidatus Elulimicrobiales bacterium]